MDIALRVQVEPNDTSAPGLFLIHPGHRLQRLEADDALFNQYHSFQQDDTLPMVLPREDVIGIKNDGLGVAWDVLREAHRLREAGRAGEGHEYRQGQDRVEQPSHMGKPAHPFFLLADTLSLRRR
jgi:hypothetical protein